MQVTATERRNVRFGSFEVDLASCELRKDGRKIKLQEKPFQILAILLDQPGELITREEFRRRLWPSDTFVDFEHSINTAVKKLREALEDHADEPRYIETLPKHGYRFIAAMEKTPVAEAGPVPRTEERLVVQRVTSQTRLRRRWYLLLPGAAVVVGALLLGLNVGGVRDRLWRQRTPGKGTAIPIESLAVLPFENLSGDASKDYVADGFTDELITDLAQQSRIRVVSRSSVMQYKGSRKPLPEIARELNVDAIVEGSVSLSGQQVRITAQLIQAPSDRHLWAYSYTKDKNDLVSIRSEVAATIAGLIRTKADSKDTIVLSDFNNRTGDPLFDDTLKQGLSVELEQSPFLYLVSERKVNQTLKLMGRPAGQRLTLDVTREVCQRTGSKAMLTGSIAGLGSQYVIGLKAVDCNTGDVLAEAQEQAAGKEGVLKALDTAAVSMRSKLGESLISVQKFAVPIEATTSSLEALKNYSMGITVMHEKGDAPAIPFLKRAIKLDPTFPLAYAALGNSYGNLNQRSLAMEYATKAYQLRDRVSELEKLRITGTYFQTTGEVEKEAQTYQLWEANYPEDFVPHNNLGAIYNSMGQFEKSLVEFQEMLRLKPENVIGYEDLGGTYLFVNRLDEAKATFDQARAHKLDDGGLRVSVYYLAFLRGDAAQMEQQVAWGAGRPGDEDLLLSAQSDTEAFYGRMSKARDYSRRAMASAVRAESKETAASWQVNAALREAELGNAASARQGVTAALALSPGRDVKVVAALALARIGDGSRAKALAEELEKDYPTYTMLKLYWLPTIHAAIEIGKDNSSQALLDLEPVAPYELGIAGGFIFYVYPAYVRGQAYLLAHNGTAAASEFQKLLDHRGIVLNFVTGSLAHLQIGRAYAMAGDTVKAKAEYQDFFTLWKDADPDVPILKEAKTEYAKLQ